MIDWKVIAAVVVVVVVLAVMWVRLLEREDIP